VAVARKSPSSVKGAVSGAAEAGLGLAAVGVETVSQDEGVGEDVEVTQGSLSLACAGAQTDRN